jgi:uncharacterized RDD family membrane protein YckC
VTADQPSAHVPPLATPLRRLAARALDELVIFAPALLGALGSAAVLVAQEGEISALTFVPAGLGLLGLVAVLVHQVVLLVRTGQTLAKRWLGLAIVTLDGGRPTLGAHVVRGLVLGMLGPISAAFVFRADRRGLHDLAAETRVVTVIEKWYAPRAL